MLTILTAFLSIVFDVVVAKSYSVRIEVLHSGLFASNRERFTVRISGHHLAGLRVLLALSLSYGFKPVY